MAFDQMAKYSNGLNGQKYAIWSNRPNFQPPKL